jgi:putative endopeptidase
MGDTIQGLDWISAETNQRALEKISTFNPKVGYPIAGRTTATWPSAPASCSRPRLT